MDELIFVLVQGICGLVLYLAVYLTLTWLSGKRSFRDDEIWGQPRTVGVLLVLSLVWSMVLARCEPYPFFGVLGWVGIAAGIGHLSILALVGRGIDRKTTDLPIGSSARPATRYTCGQCSAPVPDWMLDCPCCFERVPLTERAEEFLPLPSALQAATPEQMPRPCECGDRHRPDVGLAGRRFLHLRPSKR